MASLTDPDPSTTDPTADPTAPPPTTGGGGPVTSWDDPRLLQPALGNTPEVLDWVNRTTPGTPTYDPTLPPNPGGGRQGGSGGTGAAPPPPPGPPTGPKPPGPTILPPGSIGSLLAPFTQAAPNYVNPSYPTAPSFPDIPSWASPSAADAAKLPGYQFARDQGLEGLENSAAARGVTNTGGTLEDIIKFGDQFAGQNYQTARANSFDDYQTNVANKYLLPYQAAYQTWGVQNPQAGIDASNKNAFNWNNYLQGYNVFRNQQNDAFNKLYSTATLGSSVQ